MPEPVHNMPYIDCSMLASSQLIASAWQHNLELLKTFEHIDSDRVKPGCDLSTC